MSSYFKKILSHALYTTSILVLTTNGQVLHSIPMQLVHISQYAIFATPITTAICNFRYSYYHSNMQGLFTHKKPQSESGHYPVFFKVLTKHSTFSGEITFAASPKSQHFRLDYIGYFLPSDSSPSLLNHR